MTKELTGRICERRWLNTPGYHSTAYIWCSIRPEIDVDEEDEDAPRTRIEFEITDCGNRIRLEFDVYDEAQRRNSLYKIDTLVACASSFRQALIDEIEHQRRLERAAPEADTRR